MKKRIPAAILAAALVVTATGGLVARPVSAAAPTVSISEKYVYAGSDNQWYTEEAYEAAPIVTDLDGDGKMEVINSAYSLSVMDAATGAVKWKVNSGLDRSTEFATGNNKAGTIFTTPEVKDIDGDGKKEIVIAYGTDGKGFLSVLDWQGYFKPGWPKQVCKHSLLSLAVDDLDGDGKMEIVVGAGIDDPESVWVYHCDGTLAKGWPQLSDSQNGDYYKTETGTAFSYGLFADGITLGDLDGDGTLEVICNTDNAFINAYHYDGSLVVANTKTYGGRAWGRIALYEDYAEEIKGENGGWGYQITGRETRAQLYRSELGHTASLFTDVDGDGKSELLVTAMMMDRTHHTQTNKNTLEDSRYMTVYVLNSDRTRYVNKELGFDWSTPPVDLGASLKQHDSVNMSASVLPEPVAADLDGDGYKEILFNSYNGKVHCFSLDKTEHGSWPFTLPKTSGSTYEFAATPTCVDLDGDGEMEVIVATWIRAEDDSFTGINGALYILSSEGKLLAKHDLTDPNYDAYTHKTHDNGVMAVPVVADVDKDGKYEVYLNTTFNALCVYEITAKSNTEFNDVPIGKWYAKPVSWAVKQKITDGTGGGNFSPDRDCMQSEIITFLWRAAGEPEPAGAVTGSQFYAKAVQWAKEKKIIDSSFEPNTLCTRETALTYMWKYAGSPTDAPNASVQFKDVPAGSDLAKAVNWALQKEVTTGTDKGFEPEMICDRAQIVTFLYRAFK